MPTIVADMAYFATHRVLIADEQQYGTYGGTVRIFVVTSPHYLTVARVYLQQVESVSLSLLLGYWRWRITHHRPED